MARFGGDEFCVLCSGCSGSFIQTALDRLTQTFESSELARRYPDLSWSAGVATLEGGADMSLDELLKVADARMYCAKAERRPSTSRARALSL